MLGERWVNNLIYHAILQQVAKLMVDLLKSFPDVVALMWRTFKDLNQLL